MNAMLGGSRLGVLPGANRSTGGSRSKAQGRPSHFFKERCQAALTGRTCILRGNFQMTCGRAFSWRVSLTCAVCEAGGFFLEFCRSQRRLFHRSNRETGYEPIELQNLNDKSEVLS